MGRRGRRAVFSYGPLEKGQLYVPSKTRKRPSVRRAGWAEEPGGPGDPPPGSPPGTVGTRPNVGDVTPADNPTPGTPESAPAEDTRQEERGAPSTSDETSQADYAAFFSVYGDLFPDDFFQGDSDTV